MPMYMLSVCYPAGAVQPDEERLARIMADVEKLNAEMIAAGAWVFAGGLHDASSATVVTDQDGEVVMTDGPFIEAKEQLGGITILDVADLDVALGWASRMATVITVPIEVRPFAHAFGS